MVAEQIRGAPETGGEGRVVRQQAMGIHVPDVQAAEGREARQASGVHRPSAGGAAHEVQTVQVFERPLRRNLDASHTQ